MFIDDLTTGLDPYDPLLALVTGDDYLLHPPEVEVLQDPTGPGPVYRYTGLGWSALFVMDDM